MRIFEALPSLVPAEKWACTQTVHAGDLAISVIYYYQPSDEDSPPVMRCAFAVTSDTSPVQYTLKNVCPRAMAAALALTITGGDSTYTEEEVSEMYELAEVLQPPAHVPKLQHLRFIP